MDCKTYPSIFNDVMGPIMRGPSSSHCAASVNIGRIARELMSGNIKEVLVEFDSKGSLATTHQSQGSDMGLYGGFLGWDPFDERLLNYIQAIKDAGIKVSIKIIDLKTEHPNTYRLMLRNENETHKMTAISTGGGMIEIIEIDSVQVSILGDYYETLIYTNDNKILSYLRKNLSVDYIKVCNGEGIKFVEVKAQNFLDKKFLQKLKLKFTISSVKEILPVLPVLSRKRMEVPFKTCEEMMNYNADKNLDLWELAAYYESVRGNITTEEVFKKMQNIANIMKNSILKGIEGTFFKNRILGYQSGFFKAQMERKKLLDGGILDQMILYATAMMEMKSSMGVIVAAPTAGSCGVLSGSCIGAGDAMGLSVDEITKSLLAASIIGVFISAAATFAAEIGGCQAECGAASGMAAAGLVYLGKGNTIQAIAAASMALQNIFGMTCDPVANRVEVPCLGKNVMAVSNALSCANLALANFDAVVSLDEVIEAMDTVGKSIPYELRCTALGGLSLTKTSKFLEEKLSK
jgi:L-serine dehydratase